MPSFEEEAFNRAQQMHRKPQFNREAPRREVPKQPEKQEEPKSELPEPPVLKKDDGLLNLMFKNKEQSLILLLVILLMEENTNPSVLLALMYLRCDYRICPFPLMIYFELVSSLSPIGPLAWSFWVEIPISAPSPNSPPSVKRVDAFT